MGNQGTAEDGLRRGVEIIRSGAIGPVREVHVWTNRPIWPQGAEAILQVGPARAAALAALHGTVAPPAEPAKPPEHVHWDLFLGPAQERPYARIYHPFSWRGWWDFGTGALGDMACHTANLPFMALKLGAPTSVVAESGDINPETYPTWARITFEFPARGDQPPVKLVWYEGLKSAKRVLPDAKLVHGKPFSDSGSLMVGDKGVLFSPNDYGEKYQLLPEKDFEGYKPPESTLPRLGAGNNDLHQKEEWVRAIKEGKPQIALSNFDYAAVLTEGILLGNVALRAGGKKLLWDGPECRVTNDSAANALLKTDYRKGWSL
jgi:predicted dehydrogenase